MGEGASGKLEVRGARVWDLALPGGARVGWGAIRRTQVHVGVADTVKAMLREGGKEKICL